MIKKILIALVALNVTACQNTVSSTNPSPTPTNSVIPTASPSSIVAIKYTREDYIRMFECVAKLPNITPTQRGRTAAHLSLIKNDMLWEIHNKEGSGQLVIYTETANTIAIPLGCN